MAVIDFFSFFMYISKQMIPNKFTFLTLYQMSLDKLVDSVKSYELGERSTGIKIKVLKTGRIWKFGFGRGMSLDLGVLVYCSTRIG
jgi:hypothetical protein